MDGLPSFGQTSKLLHSFSVYVKLKLFWLRRTQLVLIYVKLNCLIYVELNCFVYVELNVSLVRQTHVFLYIELNLIVLDTSISILSVSLLNSAARLLNSVSRSFHSCRLPSWNVPSVALPSIHTSWRVPLFCTLHSVQECHCMLYQESTLLCLLCTLHYSEFWNTVAHINPVIMHRLTF